MNDYYDYNYNYDDGSSYSYNQGSPVIGGLKGFVGAVIGAVPGTLLWVILGKIGIVASACGLLVALGIVFGYNFMTKDGEVPISVCVVICFVVFVGALVIGERIVWTWQITDVLIQNIPQFREEIIEAALEKSDYTRQEIEEAFTDEMFSNMLKKTFGIRKATFGECFSNFSSLLKALDLKGRYYTSLGKSLVFGLVGGGYTIAKITNGKNSF